MQELSIKDAAPEIRIQAIQQSRLRTLVSNEAVLNRMAEAAALMLNSDALRACETESILGALYKAATLGFRIEPEFGECWLIPRNLKYKDGNDWKQRNVCMFQVGYKGWKALALQSGNVAYLQAHEVYDADDFSFEYGTDAYLKHIPAKENNGVMRNFYALAKLVNGFCAFEVITIQDAEKSRRNSETQYEWIGEGRNKVKKYSETPKDVWGKFYAQMALRVPVKRLCASLPLTPAIELAMREDGGVTYVNQDGKVIFTPPVEVEKQADEANPVEDTETLPEKYFTIKEEVQSLDFEKYCEYFEGFVGTDIFKASKETREMVIELGMNKVQSIEQLARVFNMLPGASQKDVSLKSFFTKKKTQLT